MTGRSVSRYRVLEQVGGGGMGVVYRARDTRLGRHVALKFLAEELTRDRGALERFHREAHAASALNHPHICTVYDFAEEGGRPCLVMEWLEGETLRSRIARKPLAVAEVQGDPRIAPERGSRFLAGRTMCTGTGLRAGRPTAGGSRSTPIAEATSISGRSMRTAAGCGRSIARRWGTSGIRVWSPDGTHLAFYHPKEERLFPTDLPAPGAAQILKRLEPQFRPWSWSPEGLRIAGYKRS